MEEYETLVQGLQKALDLGIHHLLVSGDFELVVNQIRDKYEVHNPCLKQYHRRDKELIEKFLSFNIQAVPSAANHVADTLALVGSCFTSDFVRAIKDIKSKFYIDLRYLITLTLGIFFILTNKSVGSFKTRRNSNIYISSMSWKRKPGT